ncbi:hypothetical protein FOQG_04871 [Fusarium oxysporum f. sp. raphani 54005]|uniref:Uncharacterized protein n=2 Tax=Fusarium oxysporum TaxID=5507 RepID=X0CGS6_FUSOX|nr:hypothetical protein FOVG_01881 [Fusarium oxysporum f. sp. pisi HDV247]EXK93615.1 hypothetical protein FOQG_04871 [Fusarium oxysporum f. sp. raphani 54005]
MSFSIFTLAFARSGALDIFATTGAKKEALLVPMICPR